MFEFLKKENNWFKKIYISIYMSLKVFHADTCVRPFYKLTDKINS